jgi:hypothetical protein
VVQHFTKFGMDSLVVLKEVASRMFISDIQKSMSRGLRKSKGENLTKLHYMHVCNYQNKTLCTINSC